MVLTIEEVKKRIKDKTLKQGEFEEFISANCENEKEFHSFLNFVLEEKIEIKESDDEEPALEEAGKESYYSEEIVEQYFHDIASYSPVPSENEKEIVAKAKEGDREARDLLVTSNLKLVAKIALKYSKAGTNYIDLIQDGTIGLISAIDKYDITKGTNFSSYAVWWIKKEIINSIANKINAIKIPNYVYLQSRKLRIFEDDYINKNNKKPSYDEIGEELKLSISEIERIKESMEIGVGGFGEGFETQLGDFKTVDEIDRELDLLEEKMKVSSLMKKVNSREKKVIELYYGLNESGRKSIKEIAEELGVSVEKVKFIKNRAIAKLKYVDERM